MLIFQTAYTNYIVHTITNFQRDLKSSRNSFQLEMVELTLRIIIFYRVVFL